LDDLEFLIVLLLGAAALVRLADRVAIPYPIVLVLGGLAIGLIPGLPDIELEPEVVFLVFLPPLLTSAGFYSSPRELRAEAGALGFLAVGLVLLTMTVVAVVAHALVHGMSWPAAFVLGAVVAPTDPVAAAATFTRVGVPHRVSLLVEGEAMINDATALVAFRVAVAAAVSGEFEAADAVLDFVSAAAGGMVIGFAAGWCELGLLRRLSDRPLSIFLTLAVPYGAYVLAEEAGVSGVLAAVVAGATLGWHQHAAFSADTRLSGAAFWEVLVFGLNVMLFALLGLQFPALVDGLREELAVRELVGAALVVSLVVVAVRAGGLFLPAVFPGMPWRERLVIGWSGMRGAISLAAALSIPLSVPERPEIVFVTFVVILVTLVGQGLTLPGLLRALRLRPDRGWSPDEALARLEAAQAALDRLDELEDEGVPEEALRRLRDLYRSRFRQCVAVLGGEGDAPAIDTERASYPTLRRELITVERASLLGLRNRGELRPDVLRQIERDLDLEEARLP